MSAYVLTTVDDQHETVFLVRAGSGLRAHPLSVASQTTQTLTEARQFGSRRAASEYADFFGLRAEGWMVDSVKRFAIEVSR